MRKIERNAQKTEILTDTAVAGQHAAQLRADPRRLSPLRKQGEEAVLRKDVPVPELDDCVEVPTHNAPIARLVVVHINAAANTVPRTQPRVAGARRTAALNARRAARRGTAEYATPPPQQQPRNNSTLDTLRIGLQHLLAKN